MALDSWWEVQAQLLMLCGTLLRAPTTRDEAEDDPHETLLRIVQRVFRLTASRNVLQVGLVHVAKLLERYPQLLPAWVAALLAQPAQLRQRLLTAAQPARIAYVMGPASRLYEEKAVDVPKLPVARACLAQVEATGVPHLELEHAEVLAAMADTSVCGLDPGWEEFYIESLMAYVLVALVDPELHAVVTDLLTNIWTDPLIGQACLDASAQTLVQTLRVRYSEVERAKVDEKDLLAFFRRLLDADAPRAAAIRAVVEAFKQEHSAEFARSQLGSLL